MGRLTTAIIVATLNVVFIFTFAASVVTLSTPTVPLFVDNDYFIHWTISGTTPATGIIYVTNTGNQNRTTITSNANLSSLTQDWRVNVIPGSYFFTLDYSGNEALSGTFQVINYNGTSSPSSNSSSPDNTPATTGAEPTAAGTTAAGTTAGGTTPTAGTTTPAAGTTTTPKSTASTLRSSLLGLFVGLGVVASVMIQLF